MFVERHKKKTNNILIWIKLMKNFQFKMDEKYFIIFIKKR